MRHPDLSNCRGARESTPAYVAITRAGLLHDLTVGESIDCLLIHYFRTGGVCV